MKTALIVSFQFSSFADDVLRSLLTTWVGSPYFNLGFVMGIATALHRDDCSFHVAEKSLWGVACAFAIAAWTTIPDPYFESEIIWRVLH
ncbi:MAG: hypothetical protein KF861_17205 [Planctomycetaceae bacterium]|nr:hypothetical protein [Planctomycetaceae bacterium]